MNINQLFFHSGLLLDFIFRVINLSTRVSQQFNIYKLKLLNVASIITSDEEYIFLNSSVYPYVYKQYVYMSDKPLFSYKMSNNTFYEWNNFIQLNKLFHIGVNKSIPILSLEITDKSGNVKHDLTDFIAKMRYNKVTSKESTISIGNIISVWQLYSSTVLDDNEMSVNYINTNGDFLTTTVRSLTNVTIE